MFSINNITFKGVVLGFIFSLLIGGLAIEFIMKWICKRSTVLPEEMKKMPDKFIKRILGALERGLFTCCVIINQPAWIAAWLAVKVLTRWIPAERKLVTVTITLANIYLIGNLLTVIFGIVGGLICINIK